VEKKIGGKKGRKSERRKVKNIFLKSKKPETKRIAKKIILGEGRGEGKKREGGGVSNTGWREGTA